MFLKEEDLTLIEFFRMKGKNKKEKQKELATSNIEKFFDLLKTNFYPNYNSKYVKQIKEISQSFNIRLTREQKQKFCKKCNNYFTIKNREIRLNSNLKTKEIICKNCSSVKRYPYK